MIKVIGLFKRKAGTTSEQFRSYYENNHVKMFKHLHGLAGYERYVRRYLTPVRHASASEHATSFDVITENWFSPQLYRRFFNSHDLLSSEFLGSVAQDEEKLFNRAQMFDHTVEEYHSRQEGQRDVDAPAPALKKVVSLMKRRAGMTSRDFKEYYESEHVKLVEEHVLRPGIDRYTRRYLTPLISIVTGDTPVSGIDVITELWFSDHELFNSYVTHGKLLNSAVVQIMAADEDKVIDRSEMATFSLTECETLLAQSTLNSQPFGSQQR